jgi:hypothetical protein
MRKHRIVLTYGLDMSTAPSNTGLVALQWSDVGPGLAKCLPASECTLDALALRIADSTRAGAWWAVDVPFGWPDGFAEFLGQHRMGPASLPEGGASPWTPLARRATDRIVIDPQLPAHLRVSGFSVSFDKLGATAAAWAYVEQRLHNQHRIKLDRAGQSGTIVETYPAAAWKRWGGRRPPAAISWEELAGLVSPVVLPETEEDAVRLTKSPHLRDALVCALVARARSLGLTLCPPPTLAEQAGREGWIHLTAPGSDLADLAGRDAPSGGGTAHPDSSPPDQF